VNYNGFPYLTLTNFSRTTNVSQHITIQFEFSLKVSSQVSWLHQYGLFRNMQIKTPDFEHPILRLGSVALLTGFVIIIVSTIFHPSTQPLTNHPLVFAEYANSKTWIASHIGSVRRGHASICWRICSTPPLACHLRI